MKHKLIYCRNAVCLGILTALLQIPVVAQNNAPQVWPKSPQPAANDPYFPLDKLPKEGLGGIEFLSRTEQWVVDVAPTYLRDKAFDLEKLPNGVNGRFATIARGGNEGAGYAVFSFKRATSSSSTAQ